MNRIQSVLLTSLVAFIPVMAAKGARAAPTPPAQPPAPSAQPPAPAAQPPGYPAQPPGYYYDEPPSSDTRPRPPRGAQRGTWQNAGGAPVRFAPDEPGLELLSVSGVAPYGLVRRWRHGWYAGYRVAPLYAPICQGACATRMPLGNYQLALAKDGGPAVPAYGPMNIEGPALLRASYTDRSGTRAAGWAIGVTGVVGGIVMIAFAGSDELVCDPAGFCRRRETFNGPLLAGGIGVLIVSTIVGGVLLSERDQAHISVEPLQLGSLGYQREAEAALDAHAAQGASLALHF
jgi:hypothetical protein